MKRKNQVPADCLTLGSPQRIAAEAPLPAQFFYYFFLILLGVSGAYGCFYTAFSIPVSWWAVALCAILFSGAFAALFLVRPYRVFLAAMAFFCLVTLLFLRDNLIYLKNALIQGFCRTVNTVLMAYGQAINARFITLPVNPASDDEIVFYTTAFAAFVLLLVTLFMAWLLIRRKAVYLCILLTLPFPGFALAYNIVPHYAAAAVLLLFWAFLLLHPPSPHGGKGGRVTAAVRRRGTFHTGGEAWANPASFILLPGIAACLILVWIAFPKQSFHRSDFIKDLRGGLVSGASITSVFHSGGVAGSTGKVNLQSAGDISYSGETVIRVKSSTGEGGYLKGFVGSVYNGQSWSALSGEDAGELDEILGEWKVQNYPYLFSTLFPSFSLDPDSYELTVQNVGGNPRCIYIPYGLSSGTGDLPSLDFVDDGYLRSDNSLFGTEEYSLSAISYSQDIFESLQDMYFDSAWRTGEYGLLDTAMGQLTEEQAYFAQSVQDYTTFVYSHYTQVPEALQEELDGYLQEHGLDADDYSSPFQLALAIIRQVQSENTYTLSPGTTPQGRDFVEYFLFENHHGYCVHFASAVTLLLRSAGIPARYAEGYTVSANDFQGPDGWAEIPDSRAHAWVEIYLYGYGWTPVESTPGAQNGIVDPEANTSDSPSVTETPAAEITDKPEATAEPSDEPSAQETPTGSAASPVSSSAPLEGDNGGGDASGPGNPDETVGDRGVLGKILDTGLRILAAVLVLGLLPAVLCVCRKLRTATRDKSFTQEDLNKAGLAVYAYIEKLLPYTESGSAGVPEDLYELVLIARFSQHSLTDDELLRLQDYAGKLAAETWKKAPPVRRFIGRYIRALF